MTKDQVQSIMKPGIAYEMIYYLARAFMKNNELAEDHAVVLLDTIEERHVHTIMLTAPIEFILNSTYRPWGFIDYEFIKSITEVKRNDMPLHLARATVFFSRFLLGLEITDPPEYGSGLGRVWSYWEKYGNLRFPGAGHFHP